jgi:cobalt-zinc-cadmium efflux system membrane fusion protein
VIARVPLDNAEGLWTPGLLVEGDVVVAEFPVALRVDNRALQTLEGEQGVFIKIGESYEFTALELGARDLEFTEVVEGLDAGDEYVSLNSFLLKADVEKANVADED